MVKSEICLVADERQGKRRAHSDEHARGLDLKAKRIPGAVRIFEDLVAIRVA